MLAELKVFADCRPYRRASELDVAKHHPVAARRNSASRWTSLITPVLKAAWTDQAFMAPAPACKCLVITAMSANDAMSKSYETSV